MAQNSKILESYQTLAKLLNSDKKENIDKAYDALKSIAESDYTSAMQTSAQSYRDGRDTLAQNRAKADKYLSYFLTEGGYEGSGIAADAKIKSELSYMSDVSALNRQEKQEQAQLLSGKENKLKDIESQRAKEHSDADSELAELEYKVAADKAERELKLMQMENENYWKQKTHELETKLAQQQTSTSVGNEDVIKAYKASIYNSLLDKFSAAQTADQMQAVYDSITGTETEEMVELLGSQQYNSLIKDMSRQIRSKRKEEKHQNTIIEIVDIIRKSDDFGTTLSRLYMDATFGKVPKYTREQIDAALQLYNSEIAPANYGR